MTIISKINDGNNFEYSIIRFSNLNVMGIRYEERRKKLSRDANIGDILTLERDPKNHYDINAIKLMFKNNQLGFIPRDAAKILATEMDLNERKFQARIIHKTAQNGDFYFIKVEIVEYINKPKEIVNSIREAELFRSNIVTNPNTRTYLSEKLLRDIEVDKLFTKPTKTRQPSVISELLTKIKEINSNIEKYSLKSDEKLKIFRCVDEFNGTLIKSRIAAVLSGENWENIRRYRDSEYYGNLQDLGYKIVVKVIEELIDEGHLNEVEEGKNKPVKISKKAAEYIRNINRDIKNLNTRKNEAIDNLKNEIQKSVEDAEKLYDTLKQDNIINIPSGGFQIIREFDESLTNLSRIKSNSNLFENDFNEFVKESYNKIHNGLPIGKLLKKAVEEIIEETMGEYNEIKKKDTYLIHAGKISLLSEFEESLKDIKRLNSKVFGKNFGTIAFSGNMHGEEYTHITKNQDNYIPLTKFCRHHQKPKSQDFEIMADFDSFIEELHRKIEKILEKVINYNKKFVEKRKKEYIYLFEESPFPLDDNQKTAIVTDDKHNLVVAGAGSGKTEVLTSRIAYLLKRKPDTIESNKILVLAFNKNAVKVIKKRLKKNGITVEVRTFHSLGYKILMKSGKYLKTCENPDYEPENFVKNYYKKAIRDVDFLKYVIEYAQLCLDDPTREREPDLKTKEERYKYYCKLKYTALDGEKVKSHGERAIKNFFLTHKLNDNDFFKRDGISQIRYEKPANWMKYKDNEGDEKVPKPDFFLPEYKLYIEHWALDSKGEVPDYFEGENPTEEYKKNMSLKKNKFAEQEDEKWLLVETTYGEFKDNKDFLKILENRVLDALKKKYPHQNFKFEPMEYYALVGKVWEECAEKIKRIEGDISNFITTAKAYGLKPENIEKRLSPESGDLWSPKQKAFAKIALNAYKAYEKKLKSKKEIDYSDMINLAIDDLNANEELYKNQYDHILVDEYQDISTQRYKLIKGIMDKNPNCKLFCVGDDWQSIQGFSGSNLDLFVNYRRYFNYPERTNLTINYRSIKSIVDTGTDIIAQNKNQLKKEAIANNKTEEKIRVYRSHYNLSTKTEEKIRKQCKYGYEEKIIKIKRKIREKYIQQVAKHCVDTIEEYLEKEYKLKDIMILSRTRTGKYGLWGKILEYSEEKGINIVSDEDIPPDRDIPPHIPLRTVHKSKGLQARVVFILDVTKGLYGFPCEIEDAEILEPAKLKLGERENKLEEERRLFYVAVTRAKEDVIIYTQKGAESKFLKEIKNHTDIEELPLDNKIKIKI